MVMFKLVAPTKVEAHVGPVDGMVEARFVGSKLRRKKPGLRLRWLRWSGSCAVW